MSDIKVVRWIDDALNKMAIEKEVFDSAPSMWADLKAAIDDAVRYFETKRPQLVVKSNGNQEYSRTVKVQDQEDTFARWSRAATIDFSAEKAQISCRYIFVKAPKQPAAKVVSIVPDLAGHAAFKYEDDLASTSSVTEYFLAPVLFGATTE